jgi:hypothetical protein
VIVEEEEVREVHAYLVVNYAVLLFVPNWLLVVVPYIIGFVLEYVITYSLVTDLWGLYLIDIFKFILNDLEWEIG